MGRVGAKSTGKIIPPRGGSGITPARIEIPATNCRNCGAPVKNTSCDYCGTLYSIYAVSEFTVNPRDSVVIPIEIR